MKTRTIASIPALALALACSSEPAPDGADPAAAIGTNSTAEMFPAQPSPTTTPASPPAAAAVFGENPFGDVEGHSAPNSNQAPTILAVKIVPSSEIRTDDDVTAIPSATDPEGDAIAFRYRWNVNGRPVRVDGPTLPASHFVRGDRIELTVESDDGDQVGHPQRIEPFRVANTAPLIRSAPGPLDPDGTFRYSVDVEDADADRGFRYLLRAHPDGMRIDEVAGAIVWTPRPEQAGVHSITVEVDDRHRGVTSQSFDLTIEFPPASTPAAAAP